jgi:anti-anti-sigma regulatory factor
MLRSSPPTLQIIETSVAGQLVVCFKGKACKKAAPAWQGRFLQLAAERNPLLVLDLSELKSVSDPFVTSLRRLVDCQHRHGGHIQLL